MSARIWSAHQQAIFSFVESGTGNAIVEAVAGSGKTTTLVEAVKRCGTASTIFLAFNKAIATELQSRGVNARTFHSLTYGAVMKAKGSSTVNTNKLREIVEANLGDDDVRAYGAFICKLVGLGRQAGIGCLTPDTQESWAELIDHHDLDLDSDSPSVSVARGIELAQRLLAASNESNQVDFDDMLYFAVKDGLSLPKFDFVFVDEAQDTNQIQRALLRKLFKTGTRLIAVGDPAQAIYGFRGADSDSMNLIAEEFNCARLPLSVSYRCPVAVVNYARQWCTQIEPSPDAPQGIVTQMGEQWSAKGFGPTDLVVCRTTKPLVALAFHMLKNQIGCRILGREIGQGLVKLIEKMKARGIEHLIGKLLAYTEREVQKAVAKRKEEKAAAIQDKTDAILCLVDSLDENERSVPDLIRAVDRLFSDLAGVVTLATIHKAKGLEAAKVYWLNSSKCPSKWASKEWQQQQERNLCYVATTRAQSELVLIEEKPFGIKDKE